MKSIAYFEGAAQELRRLIDTDPKQLWADSITKKLEVSHDVFPENEVVINGVWCDIGSHKVAEDMMRYVADVAVCEDCFDHYN